MKVGGSFNTAFQPLALAVRRSLSLSLHMAAHVTDGVSSPTPPVFDINSMLQAIALKDPRQRTPMDMEFLKWVQSGGKGAPPGVSTSKQIRPPSKPGASNLPSSKQAVESGIHRVQKLSPMSFQQISQEKWKDVH